MKYRTNSSDSSRGSAPKIGRHTARATSRNGLPIALRRSQVSSDSLSSCAAPGVSHGASTGTLSDIESSRGIASSRSGSNAGSGGALPVGPVSAYSVRRPAARWTLRPAVKLGNVSMPSSSTSADVVLRRPDELRAEIDDLAAGDRPVEHPPADAVARLEHRDGVPGPRDLPGGVSNVIVHATTPRSTRSARARPVLWISR